MHSDQIKRVAFDIFLKVFLIGCFVYFIPGQQFYAPQEMFFQYGTLALVALCWIIPRKREVSNLYFGIILIYALANTVLMHFVPETRMKLLNLFFGAILIKELAERIDLNFKTIGNLLALFCAFNVFWLCLQIRQIDPVFTPMFAQNMPQIDKVGFMGLKANLGVLAALCAPFIYISNRFNLLICLPLLYFGQSSTAVAAFVACILFLTYFEHKKTFWCLLALMVTAGSYYIFKIDMPEGQFGKRLIVWSAGINYLAGTQPWFGNGLGSWAMTHFTTIQENGQPQEWVWPHNSYLGWFFELGLTGIVLMYAFFKNMANNLRISFKSHRKAMAILIPLLAVSAFHFPWNIGRFAGFSCYMLACVFALLSESEKDKTIDQLLEETDEKIPSYSRFGVDALA